MALGPAFRTPSPQPHRAGLPPPQAHPATPLVSALGPDRLMPQLCLWSHYSAPLITLRYASNVCFPSFVRRQIVSGYLPRKVFSIST